MRPCRKRDRLGLPARVPGRPQERRTQLGNQSFAGIAFVTPLLATEVTFETCRVLGAVDALVRQRGVVALGGIEALNRRRCDVVAVVRVERAVATGAAVSAGVGEGCFAMWRFRSKPNRIPGGRRTSIPVLIRTVFDRSRNRVRHERGIDHPASPHCRSGDSQTGGAYCHSWLATLSSDRFRGPD